jgi:hypothetical protein
MAPADLFGITTRFSFFVWGITSLLYLWPQLRGQTAAEAMRRLQLLHGFRLVGLAFLVPGVVSPDLPAAWARRAAYGDIVAAILALLALPGPVLAWPFNVWGSADLLRAFYQGNQIGLEPGQLGAGCFIVTVLVPLLLINHALVFWVLSSGDAATAERTDPGAV